MIFLPFDLMTNIKLNVNPSIKKYFHENSDNYSRYGYNYLPMKQGQWDENTKLNMQAFNRHFCPEIFELEKFGVHLPNNQRWYKISEERLQKLLKT